jgi:hypothetical protein
VEAVTVPQWFAEVLEPTYDKDGRYKRYIRAKIGPFDNGHAAVNGLLQTLEKFRSAGIDTMKFIGIHYIDGRRENELYALQITDEFAPISL